MNGDLDMWTLLAGLPLGLLIAGVVLYFVRKKMKRERAFDERYTAVQRHARSISWMVTTAAILIAWMIVIIVEGAGLMFFLLTGIWVVHMVSYLIGAIVADQQN